MLRPEHSSARAPLDPVAALIVDEAALARGAAVLVVDDRAGALAASLLDAGHDVRAVCDDVRDERALPVGVRVLDSLDAGLAGVDVALLRLPKSLGALEEYAQALAASGVPRVVAGGRVKHMTRTQNEVLGRSYAGVRASLGRQKCRVLDASGPTATPARWPRRHRLDEWGLTVVAHGGAFSPTALDAGTRLLLRNLPDERRGRAIDLGCGTGVLAAARARAGDEVVALDASRAAVASAAATESENGLTVEVRRDDGLAGVPDASADLIVSNPPFHRGTDKDSTPTVAMIADAGRVLVPGGELWLVFNAHLPYLGWLRRDVGPSEIVARDRSYLVTRTTAR